MSANFWLFCWNGLFVASSYLSLFLLIRYGSPANVAATGDLALLVTAFTPLINLSINSLSYRNITKSDFHTKLLVRAILSLTLVLTISIALVALLSELDPPSYIYLCALTVVFMRLNGEIFKAYLLLHKKVRLYALLVSAQCGLTALVVVSFWEDMSFEMRFLSLALAELPPFLATLFWIRSFQANRIIRVLRYYFLKSRYYFLAWIPSVIFLTLDKSLPRYFYLDDYVLFVKISSISGVLIVYNGIALNSCSSDLLSGKMPIRKFLVSHCIRGFSVACGLLFVSTLILPEMGLATVVLVCALLFSCSLNLLYRPYALQIDRASNFSAKFFCWTLSVTFSIITFFLVKNHAQIFSVPLSISFGYCILFLLMRRHVSSNQ